MIKKLQTLKNKKGFTLVELIVVLVILAILAALLLPTLTKYIDRANEMKVEATARMCVMATKAEVGTAYGKLAAGQELPAGDLTKVPTGATAGTKPLIDPVELRQMAEIPASDATPVTYKVVAEVSTTGELTKLVYTSASYECTYEKGAFTIVKATAGSPNTVDNKFEINVD